MPAPTNYHLSAADALRLAPSGRLARSIPRLVSLTIGGEARFLRLFSGRYASWVSEEDKGSLSHQKPSCQTAGNAEIVIKQIPFMLRLDLSTGRHGVFSSDPKFFFYPSFTVVVSEGLELRCIREEICAALDELLFEDCILEMESLQEDDLKGMNASAGGLVWVRRRNGSWWPGRILCVDELAKCLRTKKAGTPVKLLGREEGTV
ncbi:Uncharacterized protein MA16_Dca015143 [Dendrobium catenatum]|uniref:PWWP domain-containing protein n=1 Tax=Dendrobium catenatum TaxID=906689 RepID=A0A2I0X4B5_9ASPA|nr:Uncharacterized protein MA16_Dca015143 [Dendrobium catenatum]